MTTGSGWVKLHRKLRDSFIYNNSEAVHLWIEILLSAAHTEKPILHNGKKIVLKPGQFVCSRRSLATAVGVSESKIQRLLKIFESEQLIEQQTNSKNRIITVCNWVLYQESEQQSEQQMNSKRTAKIQKIEQQTNSKNEAISSSYNTPKQQNEQQMNSKVNTNKNIKEEILKEEKERIYKKEKKKGNTFVTVEKPDGVSEQVWQDFITLRRAKKAPITETVLRTIEREAKKAKITTEEALSVSIANGWQGFKAEWLKRRTGAKYGAQALIEAANNREQDKLPF